MTPRIRNGELRSLVGSHELGQLHLYREFMVVLSKRETLPECVRDATNLLLESDLILAGESGNILLKAALWDDAHRGGTMIFFDVLCPCLQTHINSTELAMARQS